MIVDDNYLSVAGIKKNINWEQLDAEVVFEENDGYSAIKDMKEKPVNSIISDIEMPNMDGITFVKEAKKLASYKFTPVIMLTTESQDSKKQEGQAAGAKAWVVKPFQPEQMLSAVSKLIMP